jgi:transglutaminase-like putative cysteine protease
MLIRVRHATRYRYDRDIAQTSQLVRLTPRGHQGQRVVNWRVVEEGGRPLPATDDGYGNVIHLLTHNKAHDEAVVVAEGEVETAEAHGVVAGAIERLPPLFFLRRTPLSAAADAIAALAGSAVGAGPLARLHDLMGRIRKRVDYVIGATTAETTAAEALAAGRGVCQDHAHVFIAAARALGIPARYVSGYLWDGRDAPQEASHAWAEAHVPDLGWVGFDAANDVCPTPAYVRVAIGLDYREAAPIRGLTRGRAEETLAVSVDVREAAAQQ